MLVPFDEGIHAEITKVNSLFFCIQKRKAKKMSFVKSLNQFLDERKSLNRPSILWAILILILRRTTLVIGITKIAYHQTALRSLITKHDVTENKQTCKNHCFYENFSVCFENT